MQLLPIEKHNVKINTTVIKTVYPGHEFVAEKWIEIIRNIGDKMHRKTNLKASMTDFTDLLHNPEFQPLKDFAISVSEMHELHNPESIYSEVDELWGAIYQSSDYADNHNHYPSAFSFVYYLKADENSAPLVFTDSAERFTVPAIPGTFTLFPATMFHWVPPHTTVTDRVIIAGNIITRNKKK